MLGSGFRWISGKQERLRCVLDPAGGPGSSGRTLQLPQAVNTRPLRQAQGLRARVPAPRRPRRRGGRGPGRVARAEAHCGPGLRARPRRVQVAGMQCSKGHVPLDHEPDRARNHGRPGHHRPPDPAGPPAKSKGRTESRGPRRVGLRSSADTAGHASPPADRAAVEGDGPRRCEHSARQVAPAAQPRLRVRCERRRAEVDGPSRSSSAAGPKARQNYRRRGITLVAAGCRRIRLRFRWSVVS